MGFFSTFNSDALRNVTLYKGNIPAQYGGRLSSVVDVKMKDGNNQNFGVAGGIGLISSRVSVEGPLQKGKSSFIVSARRTYADIFLPKDEESKNKLYFYDLNAKLNYQINKNNSIYLTSYFGRDIMSVDKFKNNWGNTAASLRWNSIISSKLFSNTSLIYSGYDYKATVLNDKGDVSDVNPTIRNWQFKQDFSHYAGLNHTLHYGLQTSYYDFFTPNLSESIHSDFLRTPRSMWENAVYADDDFKISDKLFMNFGLRLSMLSQGKNKAAESKSYVNLEPRVMVNYAFNKNNNIRFGYSRNTQSIQTLNSSAGGGIANNDVWINLKKPQVGDQLNLAYTRKLNNGYEFTGEVFYKKMSNLVDYKDGVEMNVLDNVESNLLYNGKGRAYGLELLAKKTKGRFTGWFSYTLSKTERRIDGINNSNWYNASQDKTHNFSIVANYQLAPSWTLSGAFVYSTGSAATFPIGKYEIGGETILQYGARNSNRMPAYNRLDVNLTYEPNTTKRFKSSWSMGVYNVYGRKNPYAVTFEQDSNNPDKINTVQTSILSLVPNISYNFKF
ncbi:TonB-dependent siderophore receptor [Chryseobacterium sp. JUb7]|uniref:TonB-dependent receptor plug domain-containing protein n=1 Tax=Chryseobacterium sp. JUb7 TaxID=2940599 RepID=UPI00216A8C68|nr:TonB-dependent receptor [Chryseobacterium sp. JUb7]MCS3530185.1 hypothetical protein [Chryseobacterium sp. JUb7]